MFWRLGAGGEKAANVDLNAQLGLSGDTDAKINALAEISKIGPGAAGGGENRRCWKDEGQRRAAHRGVRYSARSDRPPSRQYRNSKEVLHHGIAIADGQWARLPPPSRKSVEGLKIQTSAIQRNCRVGNSVGWQGSKRSQCKDLPHPNLAESHGWSPKS